MKRDREPQLSAAGYGQIHKKTGADVTAFQGLSAGLLLVYRREPLL